jgi:hypothetical protein
MRDREIIRSWAVTSALQSNFGKPGKTMGSQANIHGVELDLIFVWLHHLMGNERA